MPDKFVVLINNEIHQYDDYKNIPETIDNVIEFLPEILPPPHSPEQHLLIDEWNNKLKLLLERETNASSD